ncbi:hypothetical protein AMTR_s00016p00168680 [Amborella trichopoda]|uniref:Uncharacterized protein n=1 Tax=Amborella trichopoda TaxID=13333 RepID=W1PEV0_AMBTC|nr:hypothetical protein AMTR_s00016p00168680 [Amborella trichopoda]
MDPKGDMGVTSGMHPSRHRTVAHDRGSGRDQEKAVCAKRLEMCDQGSMPFYLVSMLFCYVVALRDVETNIKVLHTWASGPRGPGNEKSLVTNGIGADMGVVATAQLATYPRSCRPPRPSRNYLYCEEGTKLALGQHPQETTLVVVALVNLAIKSRHGGRMRYWPCKRRVGCGGRRADH